MFSTPASLLLLLSTLVLPLTTAQGGLRAAVPYTGQDLFIIKTEPPKGIDCNTRLEMAIRCKGANNCTVPLSGNPVDLSFGVRVQGKTENEWELVEVAIAAGSTTKPFEKLKLPVNRTVSVDMPRYMTYSIKSNEVIAKPGTAPKLLGSAQLVNKEGIKCQVAASFK